MAVNIKTSKQVTPQCYAYILPGVPAKAGQTKIGFTRGSVDERIRQQIDATRIEYKECWHAPAMFRREPYGIFDDHDFHRYLKRLGIVNVDGEWFMVDPDKAEDYFDDFTKNHGDAIGLPDDVASYTLRDEQDDAVTQAEFYFDTHTEGEYLWNAKPRFGKTLAAYDLCLRIGAVNILIVTNRPAIANSWYSDYEKFLGPQSGLLFVSSVDGIKDKKYVSSREDYATRLLVQGGDDVKGCIEFVSLQDLKGSVYFGGRYDKLRECKEIEWDILIIDEAHEGVDTFKTDVAFDRIKRKRTLHLSGTPFKALANDKFKSDAIYNWTYVDEQKKKRDWDTSSEIENPYETLPTLNLFTYQMSEIVRDKVKNGIQLADDDVEEYAFDLNEFFATNDKGKFIHSKEVDKFLDTLASGLNFPFSTEEWRNELKHTFWLLNRVASAEALRDKLKVHPVFKDYYVVLAAGKDGGDDEDNADEKAFDRVKAAIKKYDKTITLSVGQLTTGVTIPEWTAVLMLSNMASPSLYMQAAFRAQNPYLFVGDNGECWQKTDAYVFDFDPARTLTIFEQFANDLIPNTAGEKGTFDDRKNHVRELLNFFPVYGEDDAGQMVKLDAEKVLTIPRHIHAREVVERGFMSNFLFANISGVFGAPKEIRDIISNFQAVEEPKKLPPVPIDDNTADDLHLNENGVVEISAEQVIGLEREVFGDKIYESVEDDLDAAVEAAKADYDKESKKDELAELQKTFSRPVADKLIDTAKEKYGKDMSKSTQNTLERKVQAVTDHVVSKAYGDYTVTKNQMEHDHQKTLEQAQKDNVPMEEISRIQDEFEQKKQQAYDNMVSSIRQNLHDQNVVHETAREIVETVETEKTNAVKNSIESNIRDHLRGFSRTIPIFLMAYGNENTTLANFDTIPNEVFLEVTGITIDQFRLLRDGADYYEQDENGNEIRDEEHKKHFDGHLFDEVVFDDAVREFIHLKKRLADYFDPDIKEDIFTYIPPQKTNQIFTPKGVVADMVDRLEKENPGCFDSDTATFADLYMKSGMYITEIVKRLYNSDRLKAIYPDKAARLNHIFATQVYGLAPTEIIYRVCLSYILGFSDEIEIDKHNIRLCDALVFAKDGTLEDELARMFPELKEGNV